MIRFIAACKNMSTYDYILKERENMRDEQPKCQEMTTTMANKFRFVCRIVNWINSTNSDLYVVL